MSAPSEMPYFIKPSRYLSDREKLAAYATARREILATLGDETDPIVRMVTVNCLLKTNLPYYYWVGFYLVRGEDQLVVGPYQGTLGCLYIKFGRGVCGKAAATRTTQVVPDTHTLEEGSEHIACDPNSRSEIVVPVFDPSGALIGVFDVDSTLEGSFGEIDRKALEELLGEVFG